MHLRALRSAILASLSAVVLSSALTGCQSFLDSQYRNSLAPQQGVERLNGISSSAHIRRNELGMPLIESESFHDAIFALGYVHATDRLSQMVSMRLLAEGRLAELLGPGALDLDRFMRSVELRRDAEALYKAASPRLKQVFEVYARGVNAYIFQYRTRLPMDLAQSGHRPAYWKPEDSALIFSLMSFSLSVNLQEEINSLILADKVGSEKLAWLLPVYPDEPLPFAEASKLDGLQFTALLEPLQRLNETARVIAGSPLQGVAASNNWAIAPERSQAGSSLFANDTHLPIALPSAWNVVHIRSPQLTAAGFSIAGIPAIVAGYNGKLAWGMTMVMGDNQDLFIEKLEQRNGRPYYLTEGQWRPAEERQETFFIKGQRPVREAIYHTRNGVLLNSSLNAKQVSPLQPSSLNSPLGLTLRTPSLQGDRSLDAFFNLSLAENIDQAFEAAREIRAIALNMVFADTKHIGWQVTGRYPNRLNGVGLVPSPGWNNQYDWDGYADPMLHPYDQDPYDGWLGTANQRTVPRGYGMQLSSTWYYPDRAERIAQLANASRQHNRSSMQAMQLDQTSPFAAKLQAMLSAPGMDSALQQAITQLPAAEQKRAQEALKTLLRFNGQLRAESADAALYSAFLQESAKQIFLGELGPEDSPSWKALVDISNLSYSAQADHLLGRDDSPFWDDQRTPEHEDKPTILARSLAAAVAYCEQAMGSNRNAWQWGKLHRYEFLSASSQSSEMLSSSQRTSLNAISSYLNRGPYPAGGDFGTLNTATYAWGQDFNVQLIPSMRLLVDFAAPEPLQLINSSGQSGNPASPHYADGITPWRRGEYQSMPFTPSNIERSYPSKGLLLLPSTR